MKPMYTDAFWVEHPFDGDMILIKNKDKNNKYLIKHCTFQPFNSPFELNHSTGDVTSSLRLTTLNALMESTLQWWNERVL